MSPSILMPRSKKTRADRILRSSWRLRESSGRTQKGALAHQFADPRGAVVRAALQKSSEWATPGLCFRRLCKRSRGKSGTIRGKALSVCLFASSSRYTCFECQRRSKSYHENRRVREVSSTISDVSADFGDVETGPSGASTPSFSRQTDVMKVHVQPASRLWARVSPRAPFPSNRRNLNPLKPIAIIS